MDWKARLWYASRTKVLPWNKIRPSPHPHFMSSCTLAPSQQFCPATRRNRPCRRGLWEEFRVDILLPMSTRMQLCLFLPFNVIMIASLQKRLAIHFHFAPSSYCNTFATWNLFNWMDKRMALDDNRAFFFLAAPFAFSLCLSLTLSCFFCSYPISISISLWRKTSFCVHGKWHWTSIVLTLIYRPHQKI